MKRIAVLFAAATILASGSAASAATATGSLTVQATVVDTCSVSNGLLDFGVVNPTNGTLLPALGGVSVTCSLGTPFSVGVDNGSNASSGQRRLRRDATGDYLNYELYKDLTMQARFGDTDASDRVTGQIGLGITANLVPFYGYITSGQTGGGGVYSDSIQVTVRF
jgi:spore coat protein U-like protein